MKILFLHPNRPDYLTESIFHGLRSLIGENVVDVPRMDCMYKGFNTIGNYKLKHNNGFSLYGLLEDQQLLVEKRFYWEADLGEYDFIILSNIWFLDGILIEMLNSPFRSKLVIIDGHDSEKLFPFVNTLNYFKRNPNLFFNSINGIPYFKRELNEEKSSVIDFLFKQNADLLPIAFSIPKEKITMVDGTRKTKLFVSYIVDNEVARNIGEFYSEVGSHKHLFTKESEYYHDLQSSWFGITTKRAGWDCLRHYEFAANGCILCFKDLELKPEKCAPHGLNEENCIIYHSLEDLKSKTENCRKDEMLLKTYNWIEKHTTEREAERLIQLVSLKII